MTTQPPKVLVTKIGLDGHDRGSRVVEAAEAGCTHGEICATLRRELGFGQPLAERTERELLAMLSLRHYDAWTPQVVRTVATSGDGVPELADVIERHARDCASQRLSHGGRVRRLIAASAADWVKRRIEGLDTAEFEQLCVLVQRGELDYASADLRAVDLALNAGKKI